MTFPCKDPSGTVGHKAWSVYCSQEAELPLVHCHIFMPFYCHFRGLVTFRLGLCAIVGQAAPSSNVWSLLFTLTTMQYLI